MVHETRFATPRLPLTFVLPESEYPFPSLYYLYTLCHYVHTVTVKM